MLMVFADISKAFDKVNRTMLINKLKHRGISRELINNIADLLSDTSHCLVGEDMEYRTTIGVP